jgi:hypothetical protein
MYLLHLFRNGHVDTKQFYEWYCHLNLHQCFALCVAVPPSCMQTIINIHLSFRFELEAWPVRRHRVTMVMLLLVMIALPGIDAGVIDLTNLTTRPYGRVLNAYTPLTDSNIKTAAQLWVSNEASATLTYGLVNTWDLSQVTSLAKVWCGYDETNCGSAYVAMRSFNGGIRMWDVSKVTTMSWSKSIRIV